jgi:hypothetical protein
MTLLNGAGTPAPAGKCSVDCAGDAYQSCGGLSYLSLYKNSRLQYQDCVANYTTMGCVMEAVGTRLLNGASYVNNTGMTREVCVSFCQSKSMNWAGLEYGTQCYCANKLNVAGNAGPTSLPSSSCSMPCSGKITQYCGGPSALNLYKLDNSTICPPVVYPDDSTTTPSSTLGQLANPTTLPPKANDDTKSSLPTVLGTSFALLAAIGLGGAYWFQYHRKKNIHASPLGSLRSSPLMESMVALNPSRSEPALSTSISLQSIPRVKGPRDDPTLPGTERSVYYN